MFSLIATLTVIGLGLLIFFGFFFSGSQVWGPAPNNIPTTHKLIALTFDDGPHDPNTRQLLAILKQEQVRATFFVVGKAVVRFPHTTKQIAADGHSLGNHSFNHAFGRLLTTDRVSREISQTNSAIQAAAGIQTKLYRSPWLFRAPWLFKAVKRSDMTMINGVFSSLLETWQISGEKMAKRTLKKARPGGIIIFHDGHNGKGAQRDQTLKAVRIVINQLRRQDYQFVTIPELLAEAKLPTTAA